MIADESPGQFEVFESTQLEFEWVCRNATPLTEPEEKAE
jgi:hypothetical protein